MNTTIHQMQVIRLKMIICAMILWTLVSYKPKCKQAERIGEKITFPWWILFDNNIKDIRNS